jgi:hypothetical protein
LPPADERRRKSDANRQIASHLNSVRCHKPHAAAWTVQEEVALMQDMYDRERAAALVKEARDMIAALKSETGAIAVQVSRVRHDPEDDDAPPPRPKAALAPAMQRKPNRKPFWKFWS